MKHTLLLVFLHGFKGTDQTFHNFPKDLRALLAHSLPKINVVSIQYPQYETRGDLRDCVGRFKEWLQNKVIDLEVANRTPSPTVDPSVHVVLCGHSMGGIVAAETLLSIARDEPVPHSYWSEGSSNDTAQASTPVNEAATPPKETSKLFFPYIKAVLAFDTPYLGISPGVLAHGAEEHINTASTAYKAWDQASNFFGWKASSPVPIANASARGLPAPEAAANSSGGGMGRWIKYGGVAAAVAGVAGAAYLSRNQINQGFAFASSHLEFVGCLARPAELQRRVEHLVDLTKTHDVGFANFYGSLGEEVTSKTRYAGAVLGQDRTFCVIPKNRRQSGSPIGTKRDLPSSESSTSKRHKPESAMDDQERMEKDEAEVQKFAKDTSRSKGKWVRCVNDAASDEVGAHSAMFASDTNPDYHAMLPRARDQIVDWIDTSWYEKSNIVAAPGEGSTTAREEGEMEGEVTESRTL